MATKEMIYFSVVMVMGEKKQKEQEEEKRRIVEEQEREKKEAMYKLGTCVLLVDREKIMCFEKDR